VTVEAGSSKRQLVPRWRGFEQTATFGELDHEGSRALSGREVAEMDRLLQDWDSLRGISVAAEIAGTALALRQPHRGREAAEYILNRRDRAIETEIELAERVMGRPQPELEDSNSEEEDIHATRAALHELRVALHEDFRNPIAWSEVARGYTVLGDGEKAKSAMRFAVFLAPNNRYILRAAARMHIHQGDPERAHNLIMRAPRTKSDPWLIAVEIAAADLAQLPPRLVRTARKLLDARAWAPRHLTELAATLGTIELEAGHDRNARQYFRKALERANENSLAQIEWASQQTSGLDVSLAVQARPEAFEARARANLNNGRWVDAAENTWAWYNDQPFSSEAAISGSYGTGVGGDFEQSVRFASSGLRANPDNEVLLNNAAFALLQLDRPEAARNYLRRVDVDALEDQHLVANLATRGLLEYRTGQVDAGRLLYFDAVNAAGKYPGMQTMATIHMALEELRANGPQARELGRIAARLSASIEEPAVKQWRARLLDQLQTQSGPQPSTGH
jgi:Tfp pilus assembly protein PilF